MRIHTPDGWLDADHNVGGNVTIGIGESKASYGYVTRSLSGEQCRTLAAHLVLLADTLPKPELAFSVDPLIPAGEAHLLVDGKTMGKIVGLVSARGAQDGGE